METFTIHLTVYKSSMEIKVLDVVIQIGIKFKDLKKKPTPILLLIIIKLTSNFEIQICCLKALHYYRLDIIKNTKTYACYKLYIVRYKIFVYLFSLNFIIVVFSKSDICILSTCFISSLQASFPFFVN